MNGQCYASVPAGTGPWTVLAQAAPAALVVLVLVIVGRIVAARFVRRWSR